MYHNIETINDKGYGDTVMINTRNTTDIISLETDSNN